MPFQREGVPGIPERYKVRLEPEFFWMCGPQDDPAAKVITTIAFNGVPHHIEGYAVRDNEENVQVAVHPEHEDIVDDLYNAIGASGPWMTVEMEGRTYILLVSPFCE